MSMIQVTGVLVTPMNIPAEGTIIRVTALENEGDSTSGTAIGLAGSITLDATGDYDFALVYGRHKVEVFCVDEYVFTGEVTIGSEVSSPITLPELLDLN